MKKFLSIIMCAALLLSSLYFTANAAGVIRYAVDDKPNGVYEQSTGTLHILGWAYDSSGATVHCYYTIDNGAEKEVELTARYDVASLFATECSQTNCGFNAYIPVSTLSHGEHTFKFIARSSINETVLCETTFSVSGFQSDINEIPSGTYSVDSTNVLVVSGWAFNYSGEETDCYYQIDDNARVLTTRINRSDVQSIFGGCSQVDCGFYAAIPISEFSIGTHTLKLIAVSGTSEKVIGSSEVVIKSDTSSFVISTDYYPSGNYTLGSTETVRIGGWLFCTDGSTTRCYYQIDDEDMVLIPSNNRSDVMAAYPATCTQLDCGYYTTVSFENLEKGAHTFKFIAKNSKMSEVVKEYTFYIVGDENELTYNSEILPSGTYTLGQVNFTDVQGWGFSSSGEATKFYGQFDNGSKFILDIIERTDVMNLFETCYRSDCGYHRAVNLENLSAGTHTFSVYIECGSKTQKIATGSFEIVRPTYQITFNANGGSNAPATMTKTFGQNLNLPTSLPTKKYYKFVGWNTDADGSGETIENSYKYEADDVLYAMWEHEEFELKSDSSLSFDAKNKLIYGEELTDITSTELKNNFSNTSVSVNNSFVVTGTKVYISDDKGVYDSASVVVIGDINCDGKIDGMDAVMANCVESGMLTDNELSSASYSACDCARDGKVDTDDINKLFNVGIELDDVDQSVVKSRGIYDTDFTIAEGESTQNTVMLNRKNTPAEITTSTDNVSIALNADCESFNYFGLKYSSTAYTKGTITYLLNGENYSEDFFLEPGNNQIFRSYIDGIFDNVTSDGIVSITFTPKNTDSFELSVSGIATFYREVPDIVTYYENESIKIGLNMEWGGALSYYEDTDSNIQAVSDQGIIRIESNGADKFNTESRNDNVNLINCHDTGRLVQQAYYGTHNYDRGFFNGSYFPYNPVQGGNMYNDNSKIVDLQYVDNGIYVKCRPLDWAKEKECITESYMEATYTLDGDTMRTQCRFVDYSGHDSNFASQELPAFYGLATMDRFVYYNGDEPWTDGELTSVTGIDEYELGAYPIFTPTEHWGALTGENEDSFSIGLYVPHADYMVAGVYGRIAEVSENPDTSDPSSYLNGGKKLLFDSYVTISYDYYISTGTVDNIRNSFKEIAENSTSN